MIRRGTVVNPADDLAGVVDAIGIRALPVRGQELRRHPVVPEEAVIPREAVGAAARDLSAALMSKARAQSNGVLSRAIVPFSQRNGSASHASMSVANPTT